MKSMQRERKKKNIFLLKGVDPVQVEKKYGLLDNTEHPLTSLETIHTQRDVTPISTLFNITNDNDSTDGFHFMDESCSYCITMKDSITNKRICVQTCYWCHHPFKNTPIGCPIRYHTDSVAKLCRSELSKEEYVVEQAIPKNTILQKDDFYHIPKNYYETEGSFCSFNCCLAYIQDKGRNPRYTNSYNLLMKMYKEMYPEHKIQRILPAPDWKLLREYGGFMTIEQFRNDSRNHIFVDKSYPVTMIPKMIPQGNIYEQIYILK